jgi:hypothetical protein
MMLKRHLCFITVLLLAITFGVFILTLFAFANYEPQKVCYKGTKDGLAECTPNGMHDISSSRIQNNFMCESMRNNAMITTLQFTIRTHRLAKVFRAKIPLFKVPTTNTTDVANTEDGYVHSNHTHDNVDFYILFWIVMILVSCFATPSYHTPFAYVTPILIIACAMFTRMLTANVDDDCKLVVTPIVMGYPTSQMVDNIYIIAMGMTMFFCTTTFSSTFLLALCSLICFLWNDWQFSGFILYMCDWFDHNPAIFSGIFYIIRFVLTQSRVWTKTDRFIIIFYALVLLLMIVDTLSTMRRSEEEFNNSSLQQAKSTISQVLPQSLEEGVQGFSGALHGIPGVGDGFYLFSNLTLATGRLLNLVPTGIEKFGTRLDGIVHKVEIFFSTVLILVVLCFALIFHCMFPVRNGIGRVFEGFCWASSEHFKRDLEKRDRAKSIVQNAIESTSQCPDRVLQTLQDENLTPEDKRLYVELMVQLSAKNQETAAMDLQDSDEVKSMFGGAMELAKFYMQNVSPITITRGNNPASSNNQPRGRNQSANASRARVVSPGRRAPAPAQQQRQPPLSKPTLRPMKVVEYTSKDNQNGHSMDITKYAGQNRDVDLGPKGRGEQKSYTPKQSKHVVLHIDVKDEQGQTLAQGTNGFDPQTSVPNTHVVHQFENNWYTIHQNGFEVFYNTTTQVIDVLMKPNGQSFSPIFLYLQNLK